MTVTQKLMLALAASMLALSAQAQPPAGGPGDKVITKDQFLQHAEKGFAEADADGDGALTKEERKAMHEKRKDRREDRREDRQERNAQ